jgi:hypothetical protein
MEHHSQSGCDRAGKRRVGSWNTTARAEEGWVQVWGAGSSLAHLRKSVQTQDQGTLPLRYVMKIKSIRHDVSVLPKIRVSQLFWHISAKVPHRHRLKLKGGAGMVRRPYLREIFFQKPMGDHKNERNHLGSCNATMHRPIAMETHLTSRERWRGLGVTDTLLPRNRMQQPTPHQNTMANTTRMASFNQNPILSGPRSESLGLGLVLSFPQQNVLFIRSVSSCSNLFYLFFSSVSVVYCSPHLLVAARSCWRVAFFLQCRRSLPRSVRRGPPYPQCLNLPV